MTYNTIAVMAKDTDLKLRITACAAEQQAENPEWWADTHMWQVAATPDWDTSWEYAVALDPQREQIGKAEDVITDAMILSAVQPMVQA